VDFHINVSLKALKQVITASINIFYRLPEHCHYTCYTCDYSTIKSTTAGEVGGISHFLYNLIYNTTTNFETHTSVFAWIWKWYQQFWVICCLWYTRHGVTTQKTTIMKTHGFRQLISHVQVSVYMRNSNFPTQHSCFNLIKVGKSDCSVLVGYDIMSPWAWTQYFRGICCLHLWDRIWWQQVPLKQK
jgi:hypothetical protein